MFVRGYLFPRKGNPLSNAKNGRLHISFHVKQFGIFCQNGRAYLHEEAKLAGIMAWLQTKRERCKQRSRPLSSDLKNLIVSQMF